MTEIEFADRHLGEYKIKGNEIIPRLCPFCKGGDHHDRETFALNVESHTYNCLRGSCGRHGHFSQLCKEFGEEAERAEPYAKPVRRRYKKPELKAEELSAEAVKYIELRKLTKETAVRFGLKTDSRGNIVFPYYRTPQDYVDGKATFVKYRKPKKVTKGEPKMWREKNTEPILFGMHLCNKSPRLHIFEGEFDAMCGSQTGLKNCVSVPSGCEDYTWIETCYDWLRQYTEIVIMADDDDAGRGMLDELSNKLDGKIMSPDFDRYMGCKDANEILLRHGGEKLAEAMLSAREVAVKGLINLADVRMIDLDKLPRVLSNIPSLDRATGGMFMGDLSVWTGKRGEGKSTMLTQTLLESINQGYNVCAYSGEIPAEVFQYNINLQAAGDEYAKERTDALTGGITQYVPYEHLNKIRNWYNGKFWLYDNKIVEGDEAESILRLFELAYKRYDCRVFMVDNLMTASSSRDSTQYYQMQADFCIKLRKLAEKLNVHIHLVAHPKKGEIVDGDSVGGLSEITNIACSVYSVRRLEDDDRTKEGCDASIVCLKNRAYGRKVAVKLNFSEKSRRFLECGKTPKLLGWEDDPDYNNGIVEYTGEMPF